MTKQSHICSNVNTVIAGELISNKKLQTQLQKINTPNPLTTEITRRIGELLTNSTHHTHFKHFTIFAGLLPLKWGHEIQHNSNHSAAQRWKTQISNWLILQGYGLWMIRNTSFHENNDTQEVTHQRLNEKIQHLYTLQHDVGSHDQDIFHTPIEDQYNLTIKQKQNWIETTSKTIHHCIYEHTQKMSMGQSDIRKFFNTQGKKK